jgi:hypothetical protein
VRKRRGEIIERAIQEKERETRSKAEKRGTEE